MFKAQVESGDLFMDHLFWHLHLTLIWNADNIYVQYAIPQETTLSYKILGLISCDSYWNCEWQYISSDDSIALCLWIFP